MEYSIRTEGTNAVLHQDEYRKYAVSTKTISWSIGQLNRETLALQYLSDFGLRVIKYDYQCELADSPEAMLKTIEAARLETQRKIDEEMKDNKI